jgi:hypothetical protein
LELIPIVLLSTAKTHKEVPWTQTIM